VRGEELVINKLISFHQQFNTVIENLINLINDVNNNMMIKLKATYTNDARIKLEAASLPSIEEMYREYNKKIEDYIISFKSMKKELDIINQSWKNNHVVCPHCNGEGIKYRTTYTREDGIVAPYRKGVKCEICNGVGHLVINKDFSYIVGIYLDLLLNMLGGFSIFSENKYESNR